MVQPSYFSARITLADDSGAQMALVICLQGMRWVALAREATGKAHVHFVVKAGDEAVNFQVVDAQLEIDGLIFHKIVFLIVMPTVMGFRLIPLLRNILGGYSLTPAKALNETGAPSM